MTRLGDSIEGQCPYSGCFWMLKIQDISAICQGVTQTPITPDNPFVIVRDKHGNQYFGEGEYSDWKKAIK